MTTHLGYPIYVEYWPSASKHAHQVILSYGLTPLADIFGDIEGCAEELAEAVLRCNEGRHKGHGQTHPGIEAEKAFRAAIVQLTTKDYEAEWLDLQHKIATYRLWGGPPPAAVLTFSPDDPKVTQLVLPDKGGKPVVYEIQSKRVEGLMPPPEKATHVPSKMGVGWLRRRGKPLPS